METETQNCGEIPLCPGSRSLLFRRLNSAAIKSCISVESKHASDSSAQNP